MANVCRKTCGLTSLVIPARLATALTMSWARRVLTGNAFSSAKWCSRSVPHAGRHRYDADLGPLAVGAAFAFDPELALLPEDAPGGDAAQLADAEPGVEEGPDDEPLGGRLAGVGQAIRFVGGERLSHVLIRHLPPPKSRVVEVGPRSRCAFRPPGYPHRTGGESGSRPGKQRGSSTRSNARAERLGA